LSFKSTYRKTLVATVILVLLFFCTSTSSRAQDLNYKAYSVYVYNFIKYIEWPDDKKSGEFVIAVVGDSPVLKELQQLAASKKANGQTIVVRQYKTVEEVEACKILYISNTVKSSAIKVAMERSKTLSALLITEREGQARKGAGINFITLEDDTLKFELNKKVIEGNKLKISNTLVSLAVLVG
jgi:hypothetical protein